MNSFGLHLGPHHISASGRAFYCSEEDLRKVGEGPLGVWVLKHLQSTFHRLASFKDSTFLADEQRTR